jgi:hypothetical protein
VSDTDDVFFQVFAAGNVALWHHKIVGRPFGMVKQVDSGTEGNWNTVRKRTHLPATLGAVYQEIDAAIEAHKEVVEHDDYISGLLETEPENLKMIEGLEKLQEGDPDEVEAPAFVGYNSTVSYSGIGLATSKQSPCFYMYTPPDPSVEVEGDMNINGTLRVDGKTFEEKISEAINQSMQAKTDELMMDLLEDGMKESTGPKAQ